MAVDLYGAELVDVEAHLPHRPPFGPASKPTESQADRFLEQEAAGVAAEVGPLDEARIADPADLERVRTLAKAVVVLGAASTAEAAAHPERTTPNDATSYAQWLRERADAKLARLVELVDALTPGLDPAAGAAAAVPAFHFPPPLFRRRVGF